ncbi:MAG: hypothetical protein M0R37_02785 [Bacteroidales bacterium]|nr:hypothetical protein [Bacteroidales bacterium]
MKNLANLTEMGGFCNLNYEPPVIEVVEFAVEKGFADSTTDFGEESW